jgi:predicted hydrocarbon binding protein
MGARRVRRAGEEKRMAINVADGGIKNYHNYFTPEDFATRDPRTRAIRLRDGQRGVYVSEDFLASLHLGLHEEVGDAANVVMYKCGYEWGVNDMKRFADRMRQEFGGGKLDIWGMNRKFVLESWWWPLTAEGWGGWTIDFSFEKQGMTFVTIQNSAVAKAMEQVGKPVCYMYAGLFAGIFSVYDREERGGIEVQCYSMGNDACKFLIGAQQRINAAEFWRREGAGAQEILEKLVK